MIRHYGCSGTVARIAALALLLTPIAAQADYVPLPPDLKALKQAHARAQAREAALLSATQSESTAQDTETPVTVASKLVAARVPLPPVRPRNLDPVAVAEEAETETDEAQTSVVEQTPPDLPAGRAGIHALVTEYAARHGVPQRLAHRIVMRESRYNPGLKGSGAHYGLMQISLPTARHMGYSGSATGLFDPRTNLSYAMPYLANAWLVSGGHEGRATSLYARGYYFEAKRLGLLKSLRNAGSTPVVPIEVAEAEAKAKR
jgi:soluble lytic murein transglycosylase-like protein